jgi:wyosine [tRNA(Phe)-imidazoG37] synthetase (radical SAM superfamily)
MKVFGPIPSRRLGRSLGINNIPHKVCSYSCVYCQVGRTSNKDIERKEYFKPEEIVKEVSDKLVALTGINEKVDYISIVPDGEPTLDINLGYLIELLKLFGIKVAVFTNGSLLSRNDVKADLFKADLVSIKIDTVDEDIWYKINRPKNNLNLNFLLKGFSDFAKEYNGRLITETMLARGINDSKLSIERTAQFISKLKINKSYLAVPVRPPAENKVKPVSVTTMDFALKMFGENNIDAESLTRDTATDFSHTDNFEEELLSITSVHPMNRDAVARLLKKANLDWSVIRDLLNQKKVIEVEYNGEKYYQRNFKYGYVI